MKQLAVLLICVAVISVCCWMISYPKSTSPESRLHPAPMPTQHVGTMQGSTPSRLLYLVQTESCLYDRLVQAFKNASVCQCDALVLSYKQPCTVATSSNVDYLFNSSTTWTTGRNLLYHVAKMRRSERYLYYAFIDDDIILEGATEEKQPWRAFEDFLRRIEPAVAAIELAKTNKCLPVIHEARQKHGCRLNGSPEYLPTVKFDPAVNAFHYQAVDYILPYSSKFDNVTWWASGIGMLIKCEVIFQGQVVLHTGLRADNTKHRQYPRRLPTEAPHGYSSIGNDRWCWSSTSRQVSKFNIVDRVEERRVSTSTKVLNPVLTTSTTTLSNKTFCILEGWA